MHGHIVGAIAALFALLLAVFAGPNAAAADSIVGAQRKIVLSRDLEEKIDAAASQVSVGSGRQFGPPRRRQQDWPNWSARMLGALQPFGPIGDDGGRRADPPGYVSGLHLRGTVLAADGNQHPPANSGVIRSLIPRPFGHPFGRGATRGNSTMICLFFGARGGSGAVIQAKNLHRRKSD